MSKIKLNLLFRILVSVNLNIVKNDFCYCEKIVSEFVSFQSFLCFDVTKLFLYWCSVLSIIFVRCSAPRTELLWGSNSQCDFCGDVTLPWLCSQDVIVGMYMVFLYILVFAFYVQNRKSYVTAERNWGDVNLLEPCCRSCIRITYTVQAGSLYFVELFGKGSGILKKRRCLYSV